MMTDEQIDALWNASVGPGDVISNFARALLAARDVQSAERCVCGEPNRIGIVHRTDGPCFVQSGESDAVTREQIEAWAKLANIKTFNDDSILAKLGDFAIHARAALSSPASKSAEADIDQSEDWVNPAPGLPVQGCECSSPFDCTVAQRCYKNSQSAEKRDASDVYQVKTSDGCYSVTKAEYDETLLERRIHQAEKRGEDAVYYRFRHSENEKWHYGPNPQNWWECQALGVIAKSAEGAKND